MSILPTTSKARGPVTLVAVAASLGLLAQPAWGVIINNAYDEPNRVAPADDPGWDNVVRVAGASGVYLGNRWVLTANHVSRAPARFSDGRVIEATIGSDLRLINPNGSAADLRMFRLAEDPGLPKLKIGDAPPARGSTVTMIGAGRDRAPELVGWSTPLFAPWVQVPTPQASQLGYLLLDTAQMRWGMNTVSTEGSSLAATINTFVFSTRFDRPGMPFEAQAVVGDSGGGVFQFSDDAWELVGIMNTVQPFSNQPAKSVAYGNATNAADLSRYRQQILALVDIPNPDWQNPKNYFDVDASGGLNFRDALRVIGALQTRGGANPDLTGAPGPGDAYVDVNGDRRLTTQDALRLISELFKAPSVAGASPLTNAHFVPEPSSATLAGALALWLACAAAIRRRNKRKPADV